MAKDLPQHLERHQAAQFPLVVQGPVQIENDGLNRQVEGRRGVRNGGDKLPRVGAVRWPPPGFGSNQAQGQPGPDEQPEGDEHQEHQHRASEPPQLPSSGKQRNISDPDA